MKKSYIGVSSAVAIFALATMLITAPTASAATPLQSILNALNELKNRINQKFADLQSQIDDLKEENAAQQEQIDSIETTPGQDGADGLNCWDLDGDGVQDASEDVNGDGSFNALDCKGPQGEQGQPGQDGSDADVSALEQRIDDLTARVETLEGGGEATLECSDGVDNDGDSLVDFPDDIGCTHATDPSEKGAHICDDGADNDLDGFIDMLDSGCFGPGDASELGTPATQCNDGIDNDLDGMIDTSDPGCQAGTQFQCSGFPDLLCELDP